MVHLGGRVITTVAQSHYAHQQWLWWDRYELSITWWTECYRMLRNYPKSPNIIWHFERKCKGTNHIYISDIDVCKNNAVYFDLIVWRETVGMTSLSTEQFRYWRPNRTERWHRRRGRYRTRFERWHRRRGRHRCTRLERWYRRRGRHRTRLERWYRRRGATGDKVWKVIQETRALPVHKAWKVIQETRALPVHKVWKDTGDTGAQGISGDDIPAQTFVYVANILSTVKQPVWKSR
jgi:hypothetical protein